MRLHANRSCKDVYFVDKSVEHDLENFTIKDFTLNVSGTDEVEKIDNFLECKMSKTLEASGSLKKQESESLEPALDFQIGLRETFRQKRRRRRTMPHELAILEEEYLKDERPNLLNRQRIAAKINSMSENDDKMGSREIQIWFQNKRQAMRRQTLHSVLSGTCTEVVSGSRATKQPYYCETDAVRFQQHIEHKISSFKKIPSLRLCTNEGGKAQVMFNILRENKNAYVMYKDKDKNDKCDGKGALQSMGKENVPPVYEKNDKKEMGEDEMEACARSLVGLARGW
ncbi:hypothetical protein PCANB_001615 [Pneumocystis canis]|nr:hypothetical protein PCK1_001620 [Pneumocystis canis]KAG5436862.1 hypothetical protein PCANB_001615 [Pneumocystis canis]